jgi:hypothetical protein
VSAYISHTSCHPERSMRIRFMNPHAQSKDPALPPYLSRFREFSHISAKPRHQGR